MGGWRWDFCRYRSYWRPAHVGTLSHSPSGESRPILVPHTPVLFAGFREVLWLLPDGEIEALSREEACRRLEHTVPMLCHARATARRLEMPLFPALDLLELFAFVHPARFCVPTPRGLAMALGLAPPRSAAEGCLTLLAAVPAAAPAAVKRAAGLRVWTRLPEWSESAPAPPPADAPVTPQEARARLALLLGGDAEPRPQQADYAAAVAAAFTPRADPGRPQAVLAEAGTGVGKTLGYLVPASLWAE